MTFQVLAGVVLSDLDLMAWNVQRIISNVAPAVENEMAGRYRQVVAANFGASGIDRPSPWPALSPGYAKKVGRSYATLLVGGALLQAVRVDGNKVSVSDAEVPYATSHQFGGSRAVARPYFPMNDDGSPTDYIKLQMNQVAQQALNRIL